MYLYNDNFIVHKCVSEQKILAVEDLCRNVLSKNVFSLSWLPYTWTSVISVEIMKTIDEREMQKNKTKEKQANAERSKGNRSYSERVRAKWFCCALS